MRRIDKTKGRGSPSSLCLLFVGRFTFSVKKLMGRNLDGLLNQNGRFTRCIRFANGGELLDQRWRVGTRVSECL